MPTKTGNTQDWRYQKMVAAEIESLESEGIFESLGLQRAPNRMAAILLKMERSDARRMPALFSVAGREGQAFEALAWMDGGNKSRLDTMLVRGICVEGSLSV